MKRIRKISSSNFRAMRRCCKVREKTFKISKELISDTRWTQPTPTAEKRVQVILEKFETAPADVDLNRIFNCISNIFRDWQRKYSDNPEHLGISRYKNVVGCLPRIYLVHKPPKR